MSEEKEEAAASGPKPSKLPMILLLVNFLAIAGAAVVLLYTRVFYKRPAITEQSERAKLEALAAASPKLPAESGLVSFKPVVVNLAPVHGHAHYATIGFALEIRDKSREGDVETVRPLIMDEFLRLVGHKTPQDLNNVQGRYILRTQMIDAINKIIYANAGRLEPAPASASTPPGAPEGKPETKKEGESKSTGKAEGAKKEGSAKDTSPDTHPIQDLVTNVYFSQFIVQ